MKKNRKGIFLMTVGLLLLAAALSLALYNIYDANRAKAAAEAAAEDLVKQIEEVRAQKSVQTESSGDDAETAVPYHIAYPEMEMPSIEIDGEVYIGYIEIPDLQLVLPVAGGEWDYDKLKNTPCVYAGSAYQNDMVVAAHNYVQHFGRLTNLNIGAEIRFTDAAGNLFVYTVVRTEVIEETDSQGMISGDDWDMTLFTCNYAGDKRYTVRCIEK